MPVGRNGSFLHAFADSNLQKISKLIGFENKFSYNAPRFALVANSHLAHKRKQADSVRQCSARSPSMIGCTQAYFHGQHARFGRDGANGENEYCQLGDSYNVYQNGDTGNVF